MKFRLPPQIAWPLAVIGALAVLALCYYVLNLSLWISGLAAVLVFTALYLIFDPRSAQEVQVDDYEGQAKARVRQTLDQLRAIEQLTRSMPAGPVPQQVINISHMAQALLSEVQQKRPNELLSAVSAVEYRTGKLREALDVYNDIMQDPRKASQPKYADISQRIATKTLPAVEQWLGNNLDRLNAGDILQLEVNLNQLEASQYEALK